MYMLIMAMGFCLVTSGSIWIELWFKITPFLDVHHYTRKVNVHKYNINDQ